MKPFIPTPVKSLLYKGDEKRYSPIGKHRGWKALAASIERGKELVAVERGKAK